MTVESGVGSGHCKPGQLCRLGGDGAISATDIDADPVGLSWPNIRSGLRHALRTLLDVLYPPCCTHCSAALEVPHGLCPACWSSLSFITAPYCQRLGTPFATPLVSAGIGGLLSLEAIADPPPWQRARAVVRYDGVARDLVHAMKFGDRPETVQLLGRMMALAGADLLADADLIVPTPLHRWRLWGRRFNQAALLAATLGKASGKDSAARVLYRVRQTSPQTGLGRNKRATNVQGAFAVPAAYRSAIAGKRIVLIDDVRTSGATTSAASRALLRAGCASVDVLTFALVVRD